MKEVENAGIAACMLDKDVILEPNAVNKVKIKLNRDAIMEGNLFTSTEAQKKGLWLAHTRLPKDNIFLIHNMNEKEVKLEKHMVIAQISPVNKALSCWAVFDPESTDEEEEHVRTSKHQQQQVLHTDNSRTSAAKSSLSDQTRNYGNGNDKNKTYNLS